MTFSSIGEETNFPLSSSEQLCRQVSLTTIRSTTHDFDDGVVIGFGGFGKVYRGYMDHGSGTIDVAIKRLDSMSNQGAAEFRAEIEMLSKLRHCNLVSLIGYCSDSIEKILVYEYMPCQTVDFHLFSSHIPLTWAQRLKISIGAARGLDYLHTGSGTQHGVIHRDVKSSNILLDENLDAKISDFGLSKIGPINQLANSYVNTSVRGTFGYIDPEYYLTGRLTRKSDVYAFGVVMFELLSGRRAVDLSLNEEQCSLSRWAKLCIKERKLDQIVDPNIKGQISSKCLKEFAQIAYRCLHSRAKERPTMAEVVFSLQISQALQEKFDNSASPAGIMGITRKMQKYFISPLKENSGHGHGSMPMDEGGDSNKMHHVGDQMMSKGLKVFSYNELKHATNNFHTQMRRGRPSTSAWVFKGWIDKNTYAPSTPGVGLAVSVKRLHHCYCGNLDKTKLDLKMLEEMDHPNLVKLIGYCLRGKELLLVHEFIENGSLEGHLLHGAAEKLPLVTRVKIAVGVAQGLDFLHNTQEKASKWLFEMHNILLDEDFNAKLSDFDVRKLVHGHTLEDHSLECYYHPWRNPYEQKNDNFDHGVVLLELLSVLQIRYDDQAISKQMLVDVTRRRDSPNFGSDIRLGLTRVLKKLEIMSNGIFKSPVHRVSDNSQNERMTLAMYCMPQTEKDIGPVQGIFTDETPRLYKI